MTALIHVYGDRDNERHIPSRRPSRPAEQAVRDGGPASVLGSLQRSAGNQAINRLLRQYSGAAISREPTEEEKDEEATAVQAKHQSLSVQRETVEEEEEQAAPVQAKHDGVPLQRQAAPEEEKEEDAAVQARAEVGLEGGSLSPELANRITASRGAGASLDEGTRTQMEGAFGTTFADVRVHTDSEASGLNRGVSAVAFTAGSDIFFREGTYNPGSSDGRSLLAHELTHVVQQRAMSPRGPMTVGPAGDSYEQEADTIAAQVVSAGTSAVDGNGGDGAPAGQAARPSMQRQDEHAERGF